jgi:hypothetical protein
MKNEKIDYESDDVTNDISKWQAKSARMALHRHFSVLGCRRDSMMLYPQSAHFVTQIVIKFAQKISHKNSLHCIERLLHYYNN